MTRILGDAFRLASPRIATVATCIFSFTSGIWAMISQNSNPPTPVPPSFPSLSLAFVALKRGVTGPGDASGGGGGRAETASAESARLLYLTRRILEPVCPSLRPLLRGLAGEDLASPPSAEPGTSPQPPPLPTAAMSSPPLAPHLAAAGRVLPVDGGIVAAADGSELVAAGAAPSERVSDAETGGGDGTPVLVRAVGAERGVVSEAGRSSDETPRDGRGPCLEENDPVRIDRDGGELSPTEGPEEFCRAEVRREVTGAVDSFEREQGDSNAGVEVSEAEVFDRPKPMAVPPVSVSRRLGTAQIV